MPRVFIGRLPRRCSRRDVEHFFRGYGRVNDVVLMGTFGFVEFDSHRDADDAVYELNGRDMLGERVVVEHAKLPPKEDRSRRERPNERWNYGSSRYGPPLRTEHRIVIENLSSRISWQDLKDLMRKAGDVTYADAHVSKRNVGMVEFASYKDMRAAVKRFNNYDLHGRTLKIREDNPDSRSRSRSHSRSRSRSRDRHHKRSRSRSSRSRSDSHDRGKRRRSKSRSRSRSDRRSDKRDRRHSSSDRSASRSRSRSRSHDSKKEETSSRKRSHSREAVAVYRSGSRTPSPGGRRSPSRDEPAEKRENGDEETRMSDHSPRPRSRSRSHHDGSHDGEGEERNRSRSRSRSSYSRGSRSPKSNE